MPLWFFLALVTAFLWSVVNIVDRIVVSRLIKSAMIPVIINGLVALLVGALILFFEGIPATPYFWIGLLAGGFCFVGTTFYYFALQGEEASRVVPLFAFTTLWVILGAAIFLQEVFKPVVYGGIFLAIFGSLLIMWRPGNSGGISLKSFALMVVSTLGYAGFSLLLKYFVSSYSFWQGSALTMVGEGIGSLVAGIICWRDLRTTPIKVWIFSGSGELINLCSTVTYSLAAASGFISFISATLTSQYVFIFFLTLILARQFPKILKEEFTPKILALKFTATCLIVAGVFSIALYGV